MYGTRRAADGWQSEYAATLLELGFTECVACPLCVFWHDKTKLICSVHGDDFPTAGPCQSLNWFEQMLEKKYELTKGGRSGPGPKDQKEGSFLNRVVRWVSGGLEYEANPRQSEKTS